MLNGGRCILLTLLVAGGAACGTDPLPDPFPLRQTCFHLVISYNGTKSGTAYARLYGNNGVSGVSSSDSAPSIQIRSQVYGSLVFCSGRRIDPGDIPVTADAWIDVSGTEAASCADIQSPQCQPSPGDPQAHQNAVMRFGELTTIHLDVVDPP